MKKLVICAVGLGFAMMPMIVFGQGIKTPVKANTVLEKAKTDTMKSGNAWDAVTQFTGGPPQRRADSARDNRGNRGNNQGRGDYGRRPPQFHFSPAPNYYGGHPPVRPQVIVVPPPPFYPAHPPHYCPYDRPGTSIYLEGRYGSFYFGN